MYVLIVFLPLVGSLVAGLFGKFVGESGSVRITTGLVGISCLLSTYSFYEVGISGNKVKVDILNWLSSDILTVKWSLLIDSLTVVMLFVITFVSMLVHIYSIEYMSSDPHKSRFFSYLSLFTFSMLLLVTSENYVHLFGAWEGTGVCSYLLISFWYTRIQANKAAIQAMLVNRIGDLGLALGIILIYMTFGSVEYETVFSLVPSTGNDSGVLTVIGILLFIGAAGKSAQLGLHIWLPNAMEAPSPVSALLHAATMVTAGVFLLVRSSPLLEYAPEALSIISVMGAGTAFFAATTGLLQNDLKKVIAYSTASQLGYMVFACGLSSYTVGVFHLANHAMFKALLFLSAGAIIHGLADEQDIRRMGGLVRVMPYTYTMILIGSLALMGVPFLTGFYSKDVILEVAYTMSLREGTSMSGGFAYLMGLAGAFFTAFYSMRLIHLTFLSKASGNRIVLEGAHEPGIFMWLPMILLCFGSIFMGYTLKDMIIGAGTDFWNNAIYIHPNNMVMIDIEFIPTSIKWLPFIVSSLGFFLAYFLYTSNESVLFSWKMTGVGNRLYKFFNRKWYFDKVYTDTVNQGLLHIGYFTTFGIVDKGILEIFGPFGLGNSLYLGSYKVSRLQSGKIYHYILIMLVGAGLIILL